MICDLRDGIAVILPGDYSALDLILLARAFHEKPVTSAWCLNY
jgi:hypothetical protein